MSEDRKTEAWYAARWLGAYFGSVWMGLPHALQTLSVLSGADFIFGVIAAAMEGRLKASIAFKGITKKMVVLAFAMAAHYGSKHLVKDGVDIGFDLGKVVALYYIVWEVISNVENLGLMGIRIPPTILRMVATLRHLQEQDTKETAASELRVLAKDVASELKGTAKKTAEKIVETAAQLEKRNPES